MDTATISQRPAPPHFYLFRTRDGHYNAVATHLLDKMRTSDSLGDPLLGMQPLPEPMALAFIRKRDGTLIR